MTATKRAPQDSTRTRGFFSVEWKLTLGTGLVLAAVSLLMYINLAKRERYALLSAKRQSAAAVVELFASGASAPVMFDDIDAVHGELRNVGANRDVLYAAIWHDGRDTPEGELRPSGNLDAPRPPEARDGEQIEMRADRVVVVRSVHDLRQARIGHVVAHFSLARENAAYKASQVRLLTMVTGLALGVTIALMAIARRTIVAPLDRLVRAAHKVESGEHARVDIAANDEVGRLGAAFNSMAEAIVDRERRLAAAHVDLKQLFDNTGQAIVSFGPDGAIGPEFSATARSVFRRADLGGQNIASVLFDGVEPWDQELDAFRSWVELAFVAPPDQWADVVSMAPSEVTLRPGTPDEVNLVLAFRPLIEQGRLVRVLVIATDETEKRRMKKEACEKDEQHARQMAAMRQLVTGGAHHFVAFLKRTAERWDRIERTLGSAPRILETSEIEELFRDAHTIKGEARLFELRELEALTHDLEDCLARLRDEAAGQGGRADPAGCFDLLKRRIGEARWSLSVAREQLVQASPIGEAVLDQVTVRGSDLERLSALVGTRDDEVGRIVARITSRPFTEVAARIATAVPGWAHREGKATDISVDGADVLVPSAVATVLTGALTHIVRNCIVHGIETPGQREARGKGPTGHIHIACIEEPDGPAFVIEDDGAGLDLQALRKRARALGIEVGAGDEPELVFASGVSTAENVTALGGRGVGMAAVRAEMASVGYRIRVETRVGSGTRFVLCSARPRLSQESSVG